MRKGIMRDIAHQRAHREPMLSTPQPMLPAVQKRALVSAVPAMCRAQCHCWQPSGHHQLESWAERLALRSRARAAAAAGPSTSRPAAIGPGVCSLAHVYAPGGPL
jgi:hypothetical protein